MFCSIIFPPYSPALGEKLCSQFSSSSSSIKDIPCISRQDSAWLPLKEMAHPDYHWVEEFQLWAEEEKDKALKHQEEVSEGDFSNCTVQFQLSTAQHAWSSIG